MTCAALAGLLTLSACAPVGSAPGPQWSAVATPVPVSLPDWWNKQDGSQQVDNYRSILSGLDKAAKDHSLGGTASELKVLTETKQVDLQATLAHPISDQHAANRWTAVLFDVDGLVSSYQHNVIDDNFAGLSRAETTEAAFRKSLNDFQSWVNQQLGK